jgi:hypothetical protein
MQLKIRKSKFYYYALFIFIFSSVILHSGITEIITSWGRIHRICGLISTVLVVVHFIKNSRRIIGITRIFAVVIFLLAIASYYFSKREDFFFISIFIIGSIKTDFKESAKVILKANIISILLVIILCFVGGISNNSIIADRAGTSVVRYSMGFAHPNTFATMIFQIIALIIYVYGDKMRLPGYVGILIAAFVCYRTTYSRSALYVSVLLVLMIYLYNTSRKIGFVPIWTFITKNAVKILLVVGVLASLYLSQNYRNLSGWISNIVNYDTIYSRLRLLNVALSIYPIKLFGQEVEIVSSTNYFSTFTGQSAVLDNSFVFLMIVYGVMNAIWFLYGYFCAIKTAQENKDWTFLICSLAFVILGFSEKYFVNLIYNFTVLMIGQYLYSKANIINREYKNE